MNVDLGFNINNFAPKGKQSPLGQQNMKSQGQGPKDFKSQLNNEMESQNFGSKPMPDTGMSSMEPQMSPMGNGWTASELVPQNKSGSPLQEMASQSVEGLTRRVAWQKFLQKMKSELNVSAEELMFSFQSLTPEELAQPPEKNVEKLVDNLGLNPEQSQLAGQIFAELITKTGSRPIGQELTNSQREINLSLMSQRDQEQRKLNATLNQMSQQFFMNGPKPKTPANENQDGKMVAAAGAETSTAGAFAIPKDFQAANAAPGQMQAMNLPKESIPLEGFQAQNKVSVPAEGQEANTVKDTKNLKSGEGSEQPSVEASSVAPSSSTPATAASASALAGLGFMKSAGNDEKSSEDSEFVEVKKPEANGEKLAAPPKISEENLRDLMSDLSREGEGSFDGMTQGPVDPNLAAGNAQANKGFEGLLAPTLGETANQVESMSTEDLIQKAQVMVRDGGGEVKVILQPEGLGEVAMKISVQGDKVNVEMITESDTAKKLIEKSMGDLKAHLHASQLNLESIKVDTASQLGQQLEQQYHDAQRQQAQNFMEQFRQGNQEFRRGFNELPGARMYKGQTQGEQDPAVAGVSERSKSGRRLNLVA